MCTRQCKKQNTNKSRKHDIIKGRQKRKKKKKEDKKGRLTPKTQRSTNCLIKQNNCFKEAWQALREHK